MPDKRAHRGPHPEDHELFSARAVSVLREAYIDYCLLLDRGYPPAATLKLVGDRHALKQRQRIALARCTCSISRHDERLRRRCDASAIAGQPLWIDGYNVLTTIETALSSGLVIVGRDDCCRDMASMHGTYRKVAETMPAIGLIGQTLADLNIGLCTWYLDRPVSNSGRLAKLIRSRAADQCWDWRVESVPDPDRVLAQADVIVASADSGILDRCGRWLNLAGEVVTTHLPDAWVVDFRES
jgi:hypothetical protein